jgi:hypothetical protein
MVLRVTRGMIGATMSLAPEPTKIVTLGSLFDPVGDVGTRLLFARSRPELPLVMADGVRYPGLPDAPLGSATLTGKGLITTT